MRGHHGVIRIFYRICIALGAVAVLLAGVTACPGDETPPPLTDQPAKPPTPDGKQPLMRANDLTSDEFTTSPLPEEVATLQLEVRHEDPDQVMEVLSISPGMTVADVGCGAGFYTSRLAQAVGESGKVLAIDADEFSIETVRKRVAEDPSLDPHGVVETVLCPPDDIQVPEGSVDVALLCHLDFHFYDPVPRPYHQFIHSCVRALKPGGRLLVVQCYHAAEKWNQQVPGASIANVRLPYLGARLRLNSERDIPPWIQGSGSGTEAVEPTQQGSLALLFERPREGQASR